MKRFTRVSLFLVPALMAGLAQAKPAARHSHMAARRSGYVGVDAARRSATRSVPGRVLSTKLENEEGKMQYAVTVRGRSGMHEVMVDAHTGKVASQEKVTAAEEARENAAEARASRSKRSSAKTH